MRIQLAGLSQVQAWFRGDFHDPRLSTSFDLDFSGTSDGREIVVNRVPSIGRFVVLGSLAQSNSFFA